jgi:thymidylate kinase
MSKLIVIEGGDKVGKETQSKMLTALLNSVGRKAIYVEVPYKDSFTHKVIYWMLSNGYAKTYPGLFQRIQYVNKRLFQRFVLPDLEKEHDYIVCDRWSLSTLIYGLATGVDRLTCEEQMASLREPAATIILNGKSLSDRADDSYEKDSYIQGRVRELYVEWATKNHDKPVKIVSASGTRGYVHSAIVMELHDMGVL